MKRLMVPARSRHGGVPCAAQNRSEDEYTRYELLAPDTASFKIVYDVTAVTPGAKFFFNPIRKGSEASDESVIDLMTGAPLKFHEVTGAEAREAGLTGADLDTHYIQVELARPVPDGGEGRIRILKTYKDAKSYYREGRRDRLQPSARHQAQRRRAAEGLRARLGQHSGAGDRGGRRPDRRQLHEHLSRRSAAGRQGRGRVTGSPRRQRRRRRTAASSAPADRRDAAARAADEPDPRRRARASRIARSSTSSRSPRRTRSRCTTTTRRRAKAWTSTSTSCATGSTVSEPSAKILDTGEVLEDAKCTTGQEHRAGARSTSPSSVDADTKVVLIPFRGGEEGAVAPPADLRDLHRPRALRARSTDS